MPAPSDLTWQQLIGVIAFALNVWGNLELTKVGNRGHLIRLASNACWLVYSPLVGAWALMLNHATFAFINGLGYRRWARAEREGRIAPSTRVAPSADPSCASVDDPAVTFRLIAHDGDVGSALVHGRGRVYMKIAGDTFVCAPADAIGFAHKLTIAANSAAKRDARDV